MKTCLFFLLAVFCFSIARAQKKQNVYFFKDSGREVSAKDSADYIRVIEEPDSGEKFFHVKEFYVTGKKKLLGKVSSFDPRLIYEGQVISFYKNGRKKSTINYENNIRIGSAYYFFEDGRVERELAYLEDMNKIKSPEASLEAKYKLIYKVDSLGEVYVKDGNGHLVARTAFEKDSLIEEGNYKNGFKDGVWKGKYLAGKKSYTETYADAKLVSGINMVDGEKYEYTILRVPPQFKGGITAFYKYLGNSINYPKDAYNNGLAGSVMVSFVIEKDGKITEAKIDRPVLPSIDKEALRVINASPKWIPGLERGIPTTVKYNIPIKFSLQR